MSTTTNQTYVLLTPLDEALHEIMLAHLVHLQQIAYSAITRRNLKNSEFAVVCMHVFDAYADCIANLIAGNQDWEGLRQRGDTPVARGIVPWQFCEVCAVGAPIKSASILKSLEPGMVKLLCIGAYGVSAYEIQPRALPYAH